ncbi:MAG: trypsin-like peptidase domain-containing protein [Candidatus Paceibacterota bacterium]|jgi:serine protease Do
MLIEEQRAVTAIAKALPAVVSISPRLRQNIDTRETTHRTPSSFIDSFRSSSATTRAQGGSGFIIDQNGIVVTNIHVIDSRQQEYTVTTADQTVYNATLVSTDAVHDIAFLQIENPKKITALPLGDSIDLKLGQSVLAIGNVLGLFQNTVSSGIISGLLRNVNARNEIMQEELHGLIQTDAAINPGNSGGPLITLDGKAIGINSASVAHAENIGFAIPINIIKKDLATLKKYGVITRAFLGVRYVMLDEHTQRLFHTAQKNGALIVSPAPHQKAIIAGSPADRAGLRAGDIILAADGTPLTTEFTLQDFLDSFTKETAVILTIKRGLRELAITAHLAIV